MSIGGIGPSASSIPAKGAAPAKPTPSAAQIAKRAVAKGVQDGGPVTDVKSSSDRSGATGANDYYSALGYDS